MSRGRWKSPESVATYVAAPDFVLIMPCGWGLERTLDEARALATVPAWQRLEAVRQGRAIAVDANTHFNRSGPRLVDSLELLAELLWPDAFAYGWKEGASQRWSADARPARAQPSAAASPAPSAG